MPPEEQVVTNFNVEDVNNVGSSTPALAPAEAGQLQWKRMFQHSVE
jgi:hypothetical protein